MRYPNLLWVVLLAFVACDTSPTGCNPGEPWLQDHDHGAWTWDAGTACWILEGIVPCYWDMSAAVEDGGPWPECAPPVDAVVMCPGADGRPIKTISGAYCAACAGPGNWPCVGYFLKRDLWCTTSCSYCKDGIP